jgi:hypothetical protein
MYWKFCVFQKTVIYFLVAISPIAWSKRCCVGNPVLVRKWVFGLLFLYLQLDAQVH